MDSLGFNFKDIDFPPDPIPQAITRGPINERMIVDGD
jgi:hypothetical protein